MTLIISEPPLQVLPSLALKIGLNESIVLQQIHYWLIRSKFEHDGKKWVYNSIAQWKEQFPFWSEDTILRVIKNLKKHGVLIGKPLSQNKFDKTMYYTIDYSKLPSSIPANCDHQSQKIAGISSTENTTETTKQKVKPLPFSPLDVSLPSCINSEAWKKWVQHRKQKRSPLTQLTVESQIKDLENWFNQGHDPNAIINHSIGQGWAGLFAPKGSAPPASQKPAMTNEEIVDMIFAQQGRLESDE